MLKLYTDGATKGNPGPAGIGILVSGLPQQISGEKRTFTFSKTGI